MKQWLACIFILIFSFQVLPVKELGKLLMKGTMTEEVHECGHNSDGKLKGKSEDYKLFSVKDFAYRKNFLSHKVLMAIHLAETLPKLFLPDILTPPPNFCS